MYCWRLVHLVDFTHGIHGPIVVGLKAEKTRNNALHQYHHCADLSEGIEPKCFSGTFSLECVSKIKSILPVIFHAMYGAVRIQRTHFSYGDCENTCTWSYNHRHQIGSMTHLPLFRVRSWNNGRRCMSFHTHMAQVTVKRTVGLG